ncbi:MAG: ATP-dependent Clp protease proteolytic subunit [Planctomycetes bacterium]|nr:ATP-dependent Clp protease proteolytic subunit [Planctomycetota bacterium]
MGSPEEAIRVDDEEGEEKKKGREDEITALLLKTRTVILADVITKRSAQRIISQLLLLEQDDSTKPIDVFINSPGGDADAGFAIYDMMRFIKPRLRTVCTGITASAAVIVLLAAKKEDRFALPNARVLIHQPWGGVRGFASDIQIEASEILKCRDKINRLIAAETGHPLEKVESDTKRNYWMNAEETKNYGLISKIVSQRDELK